MQHRFHIGQCYVTLSQIYVEYNALAQRLANISSIIDYYINIEFRLG